MAVAASIVRRLDAVSIPLPVILRLFVGGYFIYAGIHKAVDPIDFLKALRTYGALPETPPGGVRGNGIGSDGGTETFDAYTTTKFITEDAA